MKTFAKVTVSFILSLALFAGVLYVAVSGGMSLVETRYYQSAVVTGIESRLRTIGQSFDSFISQKRNLFAQIAETDVLKKSMEPSLSSDEIALREQIIGSLQTKDPYFLGLRLIDSTGNKIHFSTWQSDIMNQKEGQLAYKNYTRIDELDFERIVKGAKSNGGIVADTEGDRLLFVYPFTDIYGAERGYLVFYLAAADFNRYLVAANVTSISETALLTGSADKPGFVLRLNGVTAKALADIIRDVWNEGRFGIERLAENEEGVLVMVSVQGPEGFIFAQVEDESVFVFSKEVRYLLLLIIYITLFLVILLLFSLKTDDMVLIQNRINKFQQVFLKEYLQQQSSASWDQVVNQMKRRKNDVNLEIKKSLGRKGKKYGKEIDAYLAKSWDDVLIALGSQVRTGAASGVAAAVVSELQQSQIDSAPTVKHEEPKVHAKRVPVTSSVPATPVAKPVPASAPVPVETVEDVQELDEIEELEELEELVDAESVDDVEELEELVDAEPVDDLVELEEVEAVEEIEELDEVEELEEVEPVEELEELEEAEPVEELEEAEPVDDIDQAEAVSEVEELVDVEPEPTDDVEIAAPVAETVPETVAGADIVEPILTPETIEPAEPAETLELTEAAEPAESEPMPDPEPAYDISEPVPEFDHVERGQSSPATDFDFITDESSFKDQLLADLDDFENPDNFDNSESVEEEIPELAPVYIPAYDSVFAPEALFSQTPPVEGELELVSEEVQFTDPAAPRQELLSKVFAENDGVVSITSESDTLSIIIDPEFKDLLDSLQS